MTDPLARIEAMIETLGNREAGFWTPLDASQEQASNAEAQKNCGFGHFGRFGHPTENTFDDDLVGEHENAPDGGAKTSRVSRASSLIQGSVQSVQSVQRHQNQQSRQPLRFGHLEASGVQNRGAGVQTTANQPLAGRVPAPGCAPTEWLGGVARLAAMAPPRTYPAHAWQQLIVDAERFLDDWAAQAAAFGWRDWELFGCHRRAPWGRVQPMGLVLLLHGRELAALTETEAVIRAPTGARQTYRRRLRDPLCLAECCLAWELG